MHSRSSSLNSWENAYADEAIFSWFQQFKRNLFPDQVKFNSTQFNYNKAYWVKLNDITPGTVASLDAKFTGDNQLTVTTRNIGAFTLKMAGHPRYRANTPIQLTLDGKKMKLAGADSLAFSLREGKWSNVAYQSGAEVKRPGAEGPIGSAFSGRHIYVYGTKGDVSPEEVKARMEEATQAANWSVYRNAFLGRIMVFPRIVADRDVRPSDFETCDLILFGTRETNSVIERFADRLPLHLSTNDPETGLLYVFPVDGHYAVVQSGLPWWTMKEVPPYGAPLPFQFVGNFKDYILFKGAVGEPLAEGYFGKDWKLSAEQKKTLTDHGVTVK